MRAAPIHFFGRLESLRGVAAGMVAFGHVVSAFAPHQQAVPGLGLLRAFGKGDSAVLMFFVISGFVLFFAMERYRQADHAIARFLIARVFRIYPAAIATVLLIVLIVTLTGRPFQALGTIDPVLILKNVLLIDVGINGVMWTLQVELLAAPVIVAAYFAYLRFGVAALWLLFLIFAALSFVRGFNQLIGSPMLGLHAFMLGMIVAVEGRRWSASLSRAGATAAFVAASVVFFASAPVLGWTSHWGTLVATAGAGGMIALAAFRNVGPGLASRPARFFGRVSYGFYLLHPLASFTLEQPDVRAMIVRLTENIAVLPMMAALFLATVVVTVPLSYLLLLMVERPGIALGQSLFRKTQVPVAG